MIFSRKCCVFLLGNSEIISLVGGSSGVDRFACNGRVMDGFPCQHCRVKLS